MAEEVAAEISALVQRAREAQARVEFATQEDVDDICRHVGWAGVRPDFAEPFARECAEETGMGYAPDKYAKLQTKIRGVLRDMKGRPSVGVVYEDPEHGLVKYAKPMGVIGALIPVTNSEATPFIKALHCLKTRNAVVMAPHPRAQRTNDTAVGQIRRVLRERGWPPDLVIGIEAVSVDKSQELMRQSDMILATGGAGMVRAAYSSGTPSQGVGAGNAVCIIDETADLADAAEKIRRSKTFDHATSCSTENSVLIEESVYHQAVEELQREGGYLVSASERSKLQSAMWTEKGLNRAIVAQSAVRIAEIAGIALPEGKTFFMVEETGVGPEYPFSREKLSVTVAIYRWQRFEQAVNMVNEITGHSGPGHSCGIHTTREDRIETLARKARVSRLMVRQPQCLANSGSWTNGMPMSLTLGCGTWGGNSSSGNITWRHLLNHTWVASPIPSTKPPDEELFGSAMWDH